MTSAEVEHFADSGGDAIHAWLVEPRQWAFHEDAMVDRAQLVDEQMESRRKEDCACTHIRCGSAS